MHNASIVLVLWAGCGSDGCLSCSTGYFDNSTIDPKAADPNDCAYGDLQLNYFRDFCAAGNPLLRVIDQYTDGHGGLQSCSVHGGTWYYAYNKFPETPLSDADIQTEAMGVLTGMKINASTDTAVFVFTPYGEPSCAASNDCFPTGSFCAYHSWFWSGEPYLSGKVVYASMPDEGWAGANCGLGGPSPNHDPLADLEVSPLSHEADEAFTDPTPGYIFGDGWYYDGFQEIGDECAYDFIGTQLADGSNVHLGQPGTVGDPYRIQSEWSNSNGGCTLDVHGPPTLFQEVVYRDASTGTAASPQEFPIRFEEAGETGPYSSARSACCGVNTTIYATPNSFVDTYPVLNAGEHWCFDASCGNLSTYVGGYTVLPLYYFDLLHQSASYHVIGGSFPGPELAYQTAPTAAAQGDNARSETLDLTADPQEFWALRGSAISLPQMLAGTATERWSAALAFWRATAADVVSQTIDYYNQYALNFSYSVADGGSPEPPALKFYQAGSPHTAFLTGAATTFWVDSGTSFNVTDPLPGSNPTERWATGTPSGVAAGPGTVALEYYHQYYLDASYSIVDGGAPPAPSLQFEAMGAASSSQLHDTPTPLWMDANTWSVPASIGSSPDERWAASGPTDGTVGSSSPIATRYYHQLRFVMGFSVSDRSATAAPVLTSQSFGKGFTSALGQSAMSYWLDNGAAWGIDALLKGSGAQERWTTSFPAVGRVSTPLAATIVYFHEYFVTIQASEQAGAGSLTATGWYNASSSLALAADANDGWAFEGWDGNGAGAYSGSLWNPVITVTSPIKENATFYPGLTLVNEGAGQSSYQWGTSRGSMTSGVALYVPVGTNVTLTAVPASSFFVFNGYSGAVTSGRATASVLVGAPATITASFSLNYTVLGALFGGVGVGGMTLAYYLRRETSAKPQT